MSNAHSKLHRQQQLSAHAHRMRQAPSEPERVLWQALRSSQLVLSNLLAALQAVVHALRR
jgi:very-short-patch-repair endonuclease